MASCTLQRSAKFCGINAQVILTSNLKAKKKRRTFLKRFSRELIKECKKSTIEVFCHKKFKTFVHKNELDTSSHELPAKISKKGVGSVCLRNKDHKTTK